jgi:PD-(D/E)XK nuclease superfamily
MYHQNKVFMPNEEIKYEWKSSSFGVTNAGVVDFAFQQDLIKILRAKSISSESLRSLMALKLLSCSYYDTINENSYHMYVFGLFGAAFSTKASSNRESGHGRYDIAIVLEDIQRLFIFEFKVSDTMKTLNDDAKVALK